MGYREGFHTGCERILCLLVVKLERVQYQILVLQSHIEKSRRSIVCLEHGFLEKKFQIIQGGLGRITIATTRGMKNLIARGVLGIVQQVKESGKAPTSLFPPPPESRLLPFPIAAVCGVLSWFDCLLELQNSIC